MQEILPGIEKNFESDFDQQIFIKLQLVLIENDKYVTHHRISSININTVMAMAPACYFSTVDKKFPLTR